MTFQLLARSVWRLLPGLPRWACFFLTGLAGVVHVEHSAEHSNDLFIAVDDLRPLSACQQSASAGIVMA